MQTSNQMNLASQPTKAKRWSGKYAKGIVACLMSALLVSVSMAQAQTAPNTVANTAAASGQTLPNKTRVVVYRVTGDADYVSAIFINDEIVGTLLPGQSAETASCLGDFEMRADTRSKAIILGQSQKINTTQPVVYFQVTDRANGLFWLQQVTPEMAQREMRAIKSGSHLINRHLANCLPAEPAKLKSVTLGADTLFDSGKYDLLPAGYAQLSNFVNDLNAQKLEVGSINVFGYADAMGDDNENFVLSQQRADTVKAYLQTLGVKTKIVAMGRGENQPVTVGCDRINLRANKIACYKPDRRVVLEAMGLAKE